MSDYMAKIRALDEQPELLQEALAAYLAAVPKDECGYSGCNSCPDDRQRQFVEIVNSEHGLGTVVLCRICRNVKAGEDSSEDRHGNVACNRCRKPYPTCDRCGEWSIHQRDLFYFEDESFCNACQSDQLSFCGTCDVYHWNEYSDDHQHDVPCECSPQKLEFVIPANSHGTLKQDERLLVELPEGAITDEAIEAVVSLLWYEQIQATCPLVDYWENRREYEVSAKKQTETYKKLQETVGSLERQWQTKRGNFTRRLSKALHDQMEITLKPGLLSRAGSTVRQHTSAMNTWHVEFTRDLNQPASAFYHEDSCWWTSENHSLCALKHWGGLGMRTYQDADVERRFPSGRAWVQPLDENLRPTQDVLGAHAYVVYNGYGSLEGYNAARLVAYLTSRTYKRIGLGISHQYVNSGGFLVADQATCDKTDSVSIGNLSHHEVVVA